MYLDERGDGAYHAGGHATIQHDKRLIGKNYSMNMHTLHKCSGVRVSMKSPTESTKTPKHLVSVKSEKFFRVRIFAGITTLKALYELRDMFSDNYII